MATAKGLGVAAYSHDGANLLGDVRNVKLRIHNSSDEGAGAATKAKSPVPTRYEWNVDGELFCNAGTAAPVMAKVIATSPAIVLAWQWASSTSLAFGGTFTLNKAAHVMGGPNVQSVRFGGVCKGALS